MDLDVGLIEAQPAFLPGSGGACFARRADRGVDKASGCVDIRDGIAEFVLFGAGEFDCPFAVDRPGVATRSCRLTMTIAALKTWAFDCSPESDCGMVNSVSASDGSS